MKRSVIIFLLSNFCLTLFLSACTQRAEENHSPLLEAFKSSNECPNVCWLGIHPGTTTTDEAIRLIKSSTQFDQEFTKQSDTGLHAYWYPEKTKTIGATSVTLNLTDGLVKSIYLGRLRPFTVKDFIDLWGAPNEISIRYEVGLHYGEFTNYTLYYPMLKAELSIHLGNLNGPDPEDFIDLLTVNDESINNYRQPWLGYWHIKDYLPGQKIPSGPETPTPNP